MIPISVRCYSGYKGEETPRSIRFNTLDITVIDMMDMWLSPDHRYFKFKGSDNGIYIIRYDEKDRFWELVFYQERGQ